MKDVVELFVVSDLQFCGISIYVCGLLWKTDWIMSRRKVEGSTAEDV